MEFLRGYGDNSKGDGEIEDVWAFSNIPLPIILPDALDFHEDKQRAELRKVLN